MHFRLFAYALFITFNTVLVGQQDKLLVPDSDPRVIHIRQQFRQNHDVRYIRESLPYQSSDFQINGKINSDDVMFTLTPFAHINGRIPLNVLSGYLTGGDGHWSVLVNPVVTGSEYGSHLLGASFNRFDLNGRIVHSLLRYTGDHTTVQLGRAPVRWGQSWDHSIIQAGKTPAYDHVSMTAGIWDFRWEILAGRLGTEFSGDEKRIIRHFAGHRLNGTFLNDRLMLEIGEQIIYSGEHRGLELFYLNPAVPYVFAAYDGDDVNIDGGNNDNSIIFADFRWIFKPDLSIYGEFILDDYQVDPNPVQDMLGWKLGLDGAFDYRGIPFTWETEFTHIDSWTYIHRGQFTSWQNRGHAIGYPYGPDVRSWRFQADAWVRDKFLVDAEYTWLEKGANTLATEWGNLNTLDDPFPRRPVTIYNLFKASLAYWMKHGIVEVGWSKLPFADEIAYTGNPEINSGVYLKLQVIFEVGFDLE